MGFMNSAKKIPLIVAATLVVAAFFYFAQAQEPDIRQDARAALRGSVEFFRTTVSTEGGYLWRYSADLQYREGEGLVTDSMAWVQPPGTPSVGEALLVAYQSTDDQYYIDAAQETAHALVAGQLESGGWDYRIEFDSDKRGKYRYRIDGSPGKRNVTTLDDDTTQSALRFLMRIDKALEFKDETIHHAVTYALDKLLGAQYPNGAWPQRFTGPPEVQKYPILKASYPDAWSRRYQKKNYTNYYTFNDNVVADMVDTLFLARDIYNDNQYDRAARKAGDFIILAQMPEPQPAWAQQYSADMHPTWARKFEPPAVTGGESQGVLRTLLEIYRKTGDEKYLEPVPRALNYLENSVLADGRMPRFLELRTNKPLYFTLDYELTYDNSNMPTHYSFLNRHRLKSIRQAYEKLKENGPPAAAPEPRQRSASSRLKANVIKIIDALDERGAWVEPGKLKYHDEENPTTHIIDCRTFAKNIRTLSEFVAIP